MRTLAMVEQLESRQLLSSVGQLPQNILVANNTTWSTINPGASDTITISNNATLTVDKSNVTAALIDFHGGTLASGPGGAVVNSPYAVDARSYGVLGGSNPLTLSGFGVVAGNALLAITNSGGTTLSGNLTNAGGISDESTVSDTISSTMDGSGWLGQEGSGTLTLSGNNTSDTGDIYLDSGTVAGNLGAGCVHFDGGTLATTTAVTVPAGSYMYGDSITFTATVSSLVSTPIPSQ